MELWCTYVCVCDRYRVEKVNGKKIRNLRQLRIEAESIREGFLKFDVSPFTVARTHTYTSEIQGCSAS